MKRTSRRRSITSRRPASRTGRRWTSAREDRGRAKGRAENHRRHVHLSGGGDWTRCLSCHRGQKTAVIRRCSNAFAIRRRARRSPRKCDAERRVGESLSRGRFARSNYCSSDSRSEKLKPLTGKTLAEVAKMRGKDPIETIMDLDRSKIESRIGTDLFPDVGRKHQEADREAVDFVWLRCSIAGARRRFPEIESASARLRKLRAVLGKYVREEKVISLAGSGPTAERAAGDESRARSSRLSEGRNVCRCRRVRSGDDRGSRDV